MLVFPRSLALLLVCGLLCGPAGADLIVVDSTGAGDATQISEAVAKARDRDTILVRPWLTGEPHFYDGFVIVDKDLRVVGEQGALVKVASIEIRDLAPDRTVVVSNLVVPDFPHVMEAPLTLDNNAGSVRISHSSLLGDQGGSSVMRCLDVVFVDCAFGDWYGAGPGLSIVGSRLAMYDSRVLGGLVKFGAGATGLVVSHSFAWLSGCQIKGGDGKEDCDSYSGKNVGGDGAHIQNGAEVIAVDTTFVPGLGGLYGGYLPLCPEKSDDGQPYVVDPSSTLEFPDLPRRALLAPGTGAEGGGVTLTVVGEPGDEVHLFRSHGTVFVRRPDLGGVLHLEHPVRKLGIFLGVVPGDGHFDVHLPVPDLPPGMRDDTQFLQTVHREPSGRLLLGSAAHVTIHDGDLVGVCARRLFVDIDAAAGGDGKDWATAYQDLEDALTELNDLVTSLCPGGGVEVWVAEGVYRLAFSIQPGGALYGGFAGTETSLEERDWLAHPTVLSGDLNGDDLPGFQNVQDNLGTVVGLYGHEQSQALAVLDGFVVEGAYGGSGAVSNEGLVRNCTLRNNHADNLYDSGAAGHMSNGRMIDCVLAGNVSENGPGGVRVSGSALVQRCTFLGNQGMKGGGLFCRPGYLRADIVQCVFSGNLAETGAGAYLTGLAGGLVRIVDCTFHGNVATGWGGGIRAVDEGSVLVANNVLWGNLAGGSRDEFSQILVDPTVDAEIVYNCIENFFAMGGEGNQGQDPLFVDPYGPDGLAGTGDENLRLGPGSPCADAGDNQRVPEDDFDLDGDGKTWEPLSRDLDGSPRFQDDPGVTDSGKGEPPIVDLGPYERPRG